MCRFYFSTIICIKINGGVSVFFFFFFNYRTIFEGDADNIDRNYIHKGNERQSYLNLSTERPTPKQRKKFLCNFNTALILQQTRFFDSCEIGQFRKTYKYSKWGQNNIRFFSTAFILFEVSTKITKFWTNLVCNAWFASLEQILGMTTICIQTILSMQ